MRSAAAWKAPRPSRYRPRSPSGSVGRRKTPLPEGTCTPSERTTAPSVADLHRPRPLLAARLCVRASSMHERTHHGRRAATRAPPKAPHRAWRRRSTRRKGSACTEGRASRCARARAYFVSIDRCQMQSQYSTHLPVHPAMLRTAEPNAPGRILNPLINDPRDVACRPTTRHQRR